MIDLPQEPVPPAVIEFAEQHNIKDVETDTLFKFVKKKCFGYDNIDEAYAGMSEKLPEFEKQPDYIYNYYTYILIENGKIRLATPKENEELNQVWFL